MDYAFDILGCNAVILWTRILQVLTTFEFFGSLLIIMRHMLRDAVLFLAILFSVMFAFSQALHALQTSPRSTAEQTDVFAIWRLLFRALFHDTDFTLAEEFHPLFGPALLNVYLVASIVLLLNLLIAQLNDTFMELSQVSTRMFLYDSSRRTIEAFKREAGFTLQPPMNLVPILLYPLLFWARKDMRWRIYTIVSSIVCLPLFLFFQGVEWTRRWLYWKTDMTSPKEASDIIADLDVARTTESICRQDEGPPSYGTTCQPTSNNDLAPQALKAFLKEAVSAQTESLHQELQEHKKLLESPPARLRKMSLS
mmetsp:Transcript_33846/g.54860  ORF Transcript_33846/g.54860 Transcript_33846/m.54860 type:complete len:310 (-) Transcript_33846:999-1928(-)